MSGRSRPGGTPERRWANPSLRELRYQPTSHRTTIEHLCRFPADFEQGS